VNRHDSRRTALGTAPIETALAMIASGVLIGFCYFCMFSLVWATARLANLAANQLAHAAYSPCSFG
jgi:hypothetical protein